MVTNTACPSGKNERGFVTRRLATGAISNAGRPTSAAMR